MGPWFSLDVWANHLPRSFWRRQLVGVIDVNLRAGNGAMFAEKLTPPDQDLEWEVGNGSGKGKALLLAMLDRCNQ